MSSNNASILWIKRHYPVLIIIILLLYIGFQFLDCNQVMLFPSIELTYVAFFLIILFYGLWQSNLHKKRLLKRREVEQAEIQILYSEAKNFMPSNKPSELKTQIDNEIGRLEEFNSDKKNEEIKELDLLPLRKLLVETYTKEELFAKAKEELRLIGEYTPDTPTYDDLHDEWKDRIEDAKKEDTKSNSQTAESENKTLKAELKALREVVAWYDKTWAQGETIIKGIAYWCAVSILAMLAIGILPIFHPLGTGFVGILHWGALGWCGALLSTIISIGKSDVNEVGEQEGKQVLLKIVGKVVIGVMTSILLYVSLIGEILGGKIFPTLPLDVYIIRSSDYWLNTGMSIFWGIFAGFSLKILSGLVGLAEGAFGKDE